MSDAYKCDRCGSLTDGSHKIETDDGRFYLLKIRSILDNKRLDLCESCATKFEEVWANE